MAARNPSPLPLNPSPFPQTPNPKTPKPRGWTKISLSVYLALINDSDNLHADLKYEVPAQAYLSIALFLALLGVLDTERAASLTKLHVALTLASFLFFVFVLFAIDDNSLFATLLQEFAHHLTASAVHLVPSLAQLRHGPLRLFNLCCAEPFHSGLSLGFKLISCETYLASLLHHSESLQSFLKLGLHALLRLDAESFLPLLDALLADLLGHNSEALGSLHLLSLLLFDQLESFDGGGCLI